MTVKSDQRKIIYSGNGVTTQFAVPFYFINNADIQASVNDGTTTTDLVLGTDYTLTGAGVETGGTLTTVSPVASGSEIAILRTVAYKQEMDIPENDIFPSQNMERALDRLTMQTQQLKEQADRAVTVDIFSDADPSELVDKIEVLYDIKDDLTTDAQNITAISTVSGSIANVNTVAGDSAEINALAEITPAISSCYSNMSAITDAPTQASNAASSASSASASATLAQKWAVDANLVASTDYSSKSWATGSLDAGSAKDWAIKEGGQVGTTGKYSAKVYSLAAENHYEKARDWASKTNGQVESTDYSAKAYAISEGLIAAGSAKEWATSTSVVADGKYGASYYALQAYNANVSAQNNKTLSQEWATKMDGQVASTDYSSKYYAGNSKVWAEGTDEQVQALGGTHSAKEWANVVSDRALTDLTNSQYTTNRVLEIPQDVNVEIDSVNNKIVLKSGSVVRHCGTWEKLTTSSDTLGNAPNYTASCLIWYNFDADALQTARLEDITSGSGAGTTNWRFNTDDNKLYYNGTYYDRSLPVCMVTMDNGAFKSIDAVFNGCGCIASSSFVVDGINALYANGRNPDGTCKFIMAKTTEVSIVTNTANTTENSILWLRLSGTLVFSLRFYYDDLKNQVIYNYNNQPYTNIAIADLFFESGKITSFRPYTVDSIANSNMSNVSNAGRSFISTQSCPSSRYDTLTIGVSGSDYIAPANGYFSYITAVTGVSSASLLNTTKKLYSADIGGVSGSGKPSLYVTVRAEKRDTVRLNYSLASPSSTAFYFIYDEGEN